MICFECQTRADPTMAARCFSYDGANVRGQLSDRSGRLIPVITIVIYANANRWVGNRSLIDLFEFDPEYESELRALSPNYKINVLELGALTMEELSRFQSEFYSIAEYFYHLRRKEKYAPKLIEIRRPEEFFTIMTLLTDDPRFIEHYGHAREKPKTPKTMCELLDLLIRDDVEKGVREGVEKGVREKTKELEEKLAEKLAQEKAIAAREKAIAAREKANAAREKANAAREKANAAREKARLVAAAARLSRMGLSDAEIAQTCDVDAALVAEWLARGK